MGALGNARVLATAGILRPVGPRTAVGMAVAQRRYGRTLAGGVAAGAVRHGDRPALTDELGTVSYADLHRRSNALAHALADRGVRPGHGLGVLARNHRHFVETIVAASKLGADAVLLNTGFSAPHAPSHGARHGRDGLRTQDPLILQLPAVGEHQAEAQVVARGAEEASAARFERRLLRDVPGIPPVRHPARRPRQSFPAGTAGERRNGRSGGGPFA